MSYEKIFKVEDGSRVKVIINMILPSYGSTNIEWRSSVYICKKNKRTWVNTVNTDDYFYRKLSLADRISKKIDINYDFSNFIYETKMELWEAIKPSATL